MNRYRKHFMTGGTIMSREYHVAVTGCDHAEGTKRESL